MLSPRLFINSWFSKKMRRKNFLLLPLWALFLPFLTHELRNVIRFPTAMSQRFKLTETSRAASSDEKLWKISSPWVVISSLSTAIIVQSGERSYMTGHFSFRSLMLRRVLTRPHQRDVFQFTTRSSLSRNPNRISHQINFTIVITFHYWSLPFQFPVPLFSTFFHFEF